MRIICTAALATDETKQIPEAIGLARRSSNVQEEEMLDEQTLERKQSTVSAQDTALAKLMDVEGFAVEILESTDFSKLCSKILDVVSQIIQRDHFTLEDKNIVENAMALWAGCILHKPELFNEFKAWKNSNETSKI